jgi:hypothetical protein
MTASLRSYAPDPDIFDLWGWRQARRASSPWKQRKTCPGASYELPEAAATTRKFPEIIFSTACRIPVWPFVVVV